MGQTITVPCEEGVVEAHKEGPGEPWLISYPWGDEQFDGSITQVADKIEQALKEKATHE